MLQIRDTHWVGRVVPVYRDLRDLSCVFCFSFSAASISSTALVEMSVSTREKVTRAASPPT